MIDIKHKESIEVSAKKQKEVEQKFIGRIVPHNGHTMFKINIKTKEIEKAKYSNKDFVLGSENKKEILIESGHIYISALNKANALKKYEKGSLGGKVFAKHLLKF